MKTLLRRNDETRREGMLRLLGNYHVTVDSILQNEQTRQKFRKFLKKDFKDEHVCFSFLIDLYEYESLFGISNYECMFARHNVGRSIIDTYICEDAKTPLPVPQEMKRSVVIRFDTSSTLDCPRDLFQELRTTVVLNLKEESLKKFLVSDTFLRFALAMSEKDPKFLDKLDAPLTHDEVSDEIIEPLEDLQDPGDAEKNSELSILYDLNQISISDDDFDQLHLDVRNTAMWRPVYVSTKRTVSVSRSAFFNGRRGLKKMCESGVVPFTVEEAFNAYVDSDYLQVIEKEISSQTEVDYIIAGKYAMSIVNLKYKLRFPLQNRDFSLILCARRESNGSITMLRKSVVHPLIPVQKGYIRGVVTGGIIFEKVGEGLTRYTQSFFVDYGGWISSALFNKLMEFRDNAWHDALTYACLERRMKRLGRPEKSWHVVQTLEHNEQYQEKNEN
jgi:hypothetical protein